MNITPDTHKTAVTVDTKPKYPAAVSKLSPIVKGALLCFIGTLLYSIPLLNFNQNIAGYNGDTTAHAATTVWFCQNFYKYSFHTTQFFAPPGIDLSNGYDMPLINTLVCPLQSFGPIVMFNIMAMIQMFLILFTSFLIARKWFSHPYIQLSFIFLYSFCAYAIARTGHHVNLLSTIWGMSLIFYLFYDLSLSNIKLTLFAFLGMAITFLSAWQNIPNLFLPITILLIAAFIKEPKKHIAVRNGVIGIILSLLCIYPFIKPIMNSYLHNRTTSVADQGTHVFNADLTTYLIPYYGHWLRFFIQPIIQRMDTIKGEATFELINAIDLGIILGLLYQMYKHRSWAIKYVKSYQLILICIIGTFVLAFGPSLDIWGKHVLPLPYYDYLSKIPPYSLTRTPARMAIATVFLVYLFALKFFDTTIKRFPHSQHLKKLPLYLCVYSIFITTLGSDNFLYPSTNYQTYLPTKGLNTIKYDQSTNYVLNIPLAFLNDPSQNFLQLFHKKPLITGYVSYASLDSSTKARVIANPFMDALECWPKDQQSRDFTFELIHSPNIFNNVLTQNSIKYVIVNNLFIQKYPNCKLVHEITLMLPRAPEYFQLLDKNENYSIYMVK